MSKIEAIVFDVGGVLMKSNDAVSEDLSAEFGLSNEQIDQFWEEYLPTLGVGSISEQEFWDKISGKFNLRGISADEDLLGRSFARELEIHQSLLNYAKDLGQRGLQLAILSDTNAPHARILKEKGVYEPFDKLFLSHETGIRKPKPEIYKFVVNQLGVNPAKMIFTDDNPANLIPAADLGMRTVLAEDSQQVIEDIEALLA